MSDDLVIGGKTFKSRLIVGTGRYRSMEDMVQALESSGRPPRNRCSMQ